MTSPPARSSSRLRMRCRLISSCDRLVPVTEQAVVAALLALVPERAAGVSRAVEVPARIGVEVGDLQRHPGRPAQRAWLGLQAAQDAGPALGGLDQQDPVLGSIVLARQQLAVELGVLQLELGLDAALERVHHRQRDFPVDRGGELQDEDVPGVLHVGDDPAGLGHRPRVRVGVVAVPAPRRLGGGQPVALHRVEPEAVRVALRPAGRAEVGPAYQRRVAVGQGRDRCACRVARVRVEAPRPVAVLLELVGGDDLVPGAAPFLLV